MRLSQQQVVVAATLGAVVAAAAVIKRLRKKNKSRRARRRKAKESAVSSRGARLSATCCGETREIVDPRRPSAATKREDPGSSRMGLEPYFESNHTKRQFLGNPTLVLL